MKVKLDDGYDWVFLRGDGKIFDADGNEIKWIPIEDFRDEDVLDEINWMPIGEKEPIDEPIDEPMVEGKALMAMAETRRVHHLVLHFVNHPRRAKTKEGSAEPESHGA